MKKKKRASVFRQLVTSYVMFSIVLAAGLYACMFVMLIGLGGGGIANLVPYELIDENGNVGDTGILEKNGGWIERLDKDYQVVEVYGQKQDEIQKYTQKEIYEYLNTNNKIAADTSAKKYRGFIKTVEKEGDTVYYLVKVSRSVLSMTYSYNLVGNDTGQRIALVFLGVFLLFFIGICFLMSRYLSRKIKQPLHKITEGMEQVVRYGVDHVRIDFQAQKEFEEIRDSFNIMTERLETEKREKRINEEKKNRMLLELSHDIKTPVATIKSYANALEEGLVESENCGKCYQIIEKKAERVNMLVNEMFLLLKLESAQYRLEPERTDVCELVRSECALHHEDLEKKKIIMRVDIPEIGIWRNLDKKEFARVIANLLENIQKYNATGKNAWVAVREKQGKVEIKIEDDGAEIAKEIQTIMFDPFVRGDKARNSQGGTGLGLAIAKKIVEKSGGKIFYEYAEGKNQFTIELIELNIFIPPKNKAEGNYSAHLYPF